MASYDNYLPKWKTLKCQSSEATWIAGDFGVIARSIENGADGICRTASASNREVRVLDVACGTGNLAIPAAQLVRM